MVIIKAYTDLEQSKKLAEILPLESADMIWVLANPDLPIIKAIAYQDSEKDNKYYEILPAWSLAALLGALLNDTSLLYFDDAYQMVYDKKPYIISNKFDNPVDVCYEMVLKLNELNLL